MLSSTTTYLETSTPMPSGTTPAVLTSTSNTIISRSVDTSHANEPRQTRASQASSTSIAASSRTTSLVCSSTSSATVRSSAASSNIERFCGQQDHLGQISPTASTSQSFPELEWNNTISVDWAPGCKSIDSAYTLTWDVCTFYLYHIINACGYDSNDFYGGSLTATAFCMVFAIAPQPYINPQPSINDQKVVCGAFDNGGGMGHRTFSTANAYDAIDKYCNGVEKYSSDPKDKSNNYGVEIIGNALDRFWYKGSAYCDTTSPHAPVPGLPRGNSTACGGSMDYEIDVRVMFNTVQTGCQPMQYYPVPKGKECSDTLGKVVSSCKYPPD